MPAPIGDAEARAASRRWRSAISTPIATRGTSVPPRKIVAREMPGVYVSLSCDVLPQIKEFERVSTTVVNAYVGPTVERYLLTLEAPPRRGGLPRAALHHAVPRRRGAGRGGSAARGGRGALRPRGRRRRRARRIAAALGRAQPHPLRHGRHQHRHLADRGRRARAGGRARAWPATASRSTASTSSASAPAAARSPASIAGGILHVGPQSAGAEPGPACYGRGGTSATVTDANLVLGYLDADAFLGGAAPPRSPRRRSARSDRLAAALGIARIAAAAGIYRIVNSAWPRASG